MLYITVWLLSILEIILILICIWLLKYIFKVAVINKVKIMVEIFF